MKVVGVDASLTGTGLCSLTLEDFLNNTPKTITLSNKLSGIERMIYIEEEVAKWVEDADLVVMEGYAYNKEFNREVLAELQGILKRRFHYMEKTLYITTTQKVKKILTGSGNKPKNTKLNTKQWTIEETKNNYGIDFDGKDDECDSFGLALIGLFYLLKDNKELIKKYPLINNVISEIEKQENKVTKGLDYYLSLPYNQRVSLEGKTFIGEIPYLDIIVEAKSLNGIIRKLESEKKKKIKSMKKEKNNSYKRVKELGKVSFLIKK